MDSRGRFLYKGAPMGGPPMRQLKLFPCDIGLEAFYRRHPIYDNPKSKLNFIIVMCFAIFPLFSGTRFTAKKWNERSRKEYGINAYFLGWKPPTAWNAVVNPLPFDENPLYEKWLNKQNEIRNLNQPN